MKVRASSQQKQNEPQRASAGATRSSVIAPAPDHDVLHIMQLQRTIGNQAVLRLLRANMRDAELASISTAPAGVAFSRKPASSDTPLKVQTRLTVSTPGDIYEQEADQIADYGNTIYRKCNGCDEEREMDVQRKALPFSGGLAPHRLDHVQSAISSGGRPLDRETRSFFEPRLGYDLSSVRIHTSSQAAESAKAIDANAYTLGNNIVFSAGQYKPESDSGKRLLAHELAHVSQAASSSTIRGDTIYRQPNDAQIMAEIQMLQSQLMAPVNPLAPMQRARLIELQAMLKGKGGGGQPSRPKPKPLIDLPFEVRFATAWDKAKEAALQKVYKADKDRGSSITRGLIKVKDLAPSPREVWKAGIYGGLFRNDEGELVEARSEEMASQTYGKRYEAARYGHIYGDERYYESSGKRRDDDTEIWSRGRAYGLFLPGEKARVLNISTYGVSMASMLNTRAGLVDPNSPDAARLMDEIHKFTSDPAVVLLGPEIERLFGPFGYTYRDQADRWFAADEIHKAYQKSLQEGQILKDPNASLAERWDACLRIRGFKENNLEEATFDPRCFRSRDEFSREYYRRVDEYQKRFDACGKTRPSHFECRDGIDKEYYPIRAAREDYQIRQSYQQYQQNVDSVVSSGAIATSGRLAGYVAAKILGRDEDEALRWSEGGAAIGGLGDAALTIKAGAKARTGTQNYNAGGGLVVSQDAPIVETNTRSSTADPWAGEIGKVDVTGGRAFPSEQTTPSTKQTTSSTPPTRVSVNEVKQDLLGTIKEVNNLPESNPNKASTLKELRDLLKTANALEQSEKKGADVSKLLNEIDRLHRELDDKVADAVVRSNESRVPKPAPRPSKPGEVRNPSVPDANKPSGNVRWIEDEPEMSDYARRYEQGATGARTKVGSKRGQVPALDWIRPDGSNGQVKYDGIDDTVLIDRKVSVTTFESSKNQALRQSEAFRQNGYTGRWEVPDAKEKSIAEKMFTELGIKNITVKIVPIK